MLQPTLPADGLKSLFDKFSWISVSYFWFFSEFVQIYKELFPNGDATKFSNYIFNIIDEDNSGSIDFEEFLQV